MKNGLLKKSLSAVLSAAMLLTVTPAMLASAADVTEENPLGLEWPAAGTTQWGGEGTVPQWAQNATAEEQQATIDAINKEYLDQKAADYDLGNIEHPEFDGGGFSSWSDMVNIQFVGGDNNGNPWGQANRDWACIIAPFPGMAFSVKGQVVKLFTNPKTAISNQFKWTNPENGETLLWQMFDDGEYFISETGEGADKGWGYAPGSELTGAVVNAMIKAYAESAYYNKDMKQAYPLGMTNGNGKVDASGIVYQEFFGPYSSGQTLQDNRQPKDGHSYGISYLVAKDLDSTEVFIVTDKIMTAWATTWVNPKSENPDRFSKSGIPLGDQKTAEDGTVTQDFEKMTISVDAEGNATIINKDNSLTDFAVEGGIVFEGETENALSVVVPFGTDVTKLAPTFTIDEQAPAVPASGAETDFTNPVTYTVTSGSGAEKTYTVTVQVAPETPAAADKEAADAVIALIDALPAAEDLYAENSEEVAAASDGYKALTPLQKILITNLDKLTAAEQVINEKTSQIRVTFAGDSITDGGSSYVSKTGALLGEDFTVFNAGVSGTTLMSTDAAYTNTNRYIQGKEFNPDIVTIMLGTNDSKDRYWGDPNSGFNAEKFETELTALVNEYRNLASKPLVIIATSPTVYDKKVDSINDPNVTEIVAVQKKVAEAMDCPLLDINAYTKDHSSWFDDGVHPNDGGHAEIAKEFAKIIGDTNKADLTSIQVGEMDIKVQDGVMEYTGYVPEGTEIPSVVATGAPGATITVEQAEDGTLPMTVKITVISENDRHKSVYTVKLEQGDIPNPIIKGDVNGDTFVNITDVMEMCRILARKTSDTVYTADELAAADMNDDKTITITDVMMLCKVLASR